MSSDGNLVPVSLDLVLKPHLSSKFSTTVWNSLVPELVPRQKSSAKFSTWKFFYNYQNYGKY